MSPRSPRSAPPAGTPVATSDGLRPIESIRAGDQVWAFDHVAGKWVLKDVLANFVHDDYHADLVHVTVGGDTIQGTMLHPFWVISGKDLDERTIRSHLEPPPEGSQIPGRWVDATDLKIGDQLLLRDGSQGVIENVRHEHVNTTVYNFAVADLRCYVVGQHQILVHNMCEKVGGSSDPNSVDPAATRPKLRKATKEQAQAAAPKTPDGDYFDPNTGQEIPKKGPFDYGHPPGQEWWRLRDKARTEGWTRKQVIEAENAKKFQIENPSSNRGHQHEQR